METFNVAESLKAQSDYCEMKKLPNFTPKEGVCWGCKRNVFTPQYLKMMPNTYRTMPGTPEDHDRIVGISVEKAGSELITGCPHCNRSYCD